MNKILGKPVQVEAYLYTQRRTVQAEITQNSLKNPRNLVQFD